MRLVDRVAIVAGAGSRGEPTGVGEAIAEALAREGARVVIVDNNRERAELTLDKLSSFGGVGRVCLADVTRLDDCERTISDAISAFGRLDILVNNVASPRSGTVVEMSESEWDEQLSINLKGVFLMSKCAIPVLTDRGGGVIVNIASISAHRATGTPAYSAAKAGIIALTREMSLAHGPDGIRINSVSPGHITTAWTQQSYREDSSAKMTDDDLRVAMSPLGTVGGGLDVANAVVFLCTDDARWIAGVDIPVDAGTLSVTPMAMIRRNNLSLRPGEAR